MDWQRPVQSRLEQREDLEVREKGVSTPKTKKGSSVLDEPFCFMNAGDGT